MQYAHSWLAQRLRHGVLEIELTFNIGLVRTLCSASMYSHPGADIEKGQDAVSRSLRAAINVLPFVGHTALSEEQQKMAEYADLIKQYKELKAKGEL